jgi:hypothetical protein
VSSVATTRTGTIDLSAIESEYVFARPAAVRAFILEHPALASLLEQARINLSSLFGIDTSIVLDVIQDPDERSRGNLYAFIQTRADPDRAIQTLDEFGDRWWRIALGSDAIPLHFTLEYV